MIDGAWGSGKSSFVKALEEELDQDEFIWIYAGSEKTVSEILGDISDQLTAILKKNHMDRKIFPGFFRNDGWLWHGSSESGDESSRSAIGTGAEKVSE